MSAIAYEDFLAEKSFTDTAAGFDAECSGHGLFGFQRAITEWALRCGRAAIFADTGLGKTWMQVVWAHHVTEHTCANVLILAPLCVSHQTVEEARKCHVTVNYRRSMADVTPGITVTNYEMIDHFDISAFGGIVLDEASILKNQTGKTRTHLIESCQQVPYRLACTATPSPNDHMELGSQSQFLGVMSAAEMLAMFFTHDGGETSKWRLKRHGQQKFWEWMSGWAVVIRKPSDLGFSNEGYDLPALRMVDHSVSSPTWEGEMFPKIAETLQERRQAQRASIADRCKVVADLVNASDEPWLIWCHLNDESATLARMIPDAVEVKGANSMDEKETRIMAFTHADARAMVTKPSIAGFGMNWQHCSNMAFVGLSDSFEQFYQAIRRCYRFGQTREVTVHLVHAESEGAVRQNLERKQAQHEQLAESMVSHMRALMHQKTKGTIMQKQPYAEDVERGDGWALYCGDCIERIDKMDDSSVDLSVFSPPFASLYTYSNSDRDMGNSASHVQFFEHFDYLVHGLKRITKPGRLCAFHCMNLPTSKVRDGVIGLTDFRGELIRMFSGAGWIYHSEVTIWKDPVTAMQRTKALGLLHKQIKKDSCMSRQGIADYMVVMRAPGENANPVTHTNETFPVSLWQKWASPVWGDIRANRTLQYRAARDNDDERHICPLQLDVIERAVCMWSNPGDLVFSPFAGIGSEGVVALQLARRFEGVELKRSYYDVATRNLRETKHEQGSLFAGGTS